MRKKSIPAVKARLPRSPHCPPNLNREMRELAICKAAPTRDMRRMIEDNPHYYSKRSEGLKPKIKEIRKRRQARGRQRMRVENK